jgi:hypothetical protein
MHWFRVLLACSVLGLVADAASLTPIFDGRLSLTPNPRLTAAEQTAYEMQIIPAARKHFGNAGTCTDDPLRLDTATGAFTRARAAQKALIYRYCSTGASFGRVGLVVFEGGKPVRHDVFEEAAQYALGRMPDLNRDGVDELILATGGTQMGETWQSASIVQLGTGKPRQPVQFEAYRDNCGSLEPKPTATAWRVYAAPGATPRFYHQRFIGSCASGTKLEAVGALQALPAQPVKTLAWTRLQ